MEYQVEDQEREYDDYTEAEFAALSADVQQTLLLEEAARYRSWANQLRYGDDLVSPEMEQQQAFWAQIYTLEDRASVLEARAYTVVAGS